MPLLPKLRSEPTPPLCRGPLATWVAFSALISLRSSLISLMRATFSCIMRWLSARCSSMFLFSLRLSDSTDFSRHSRWRACSDATSVSAACVTTAVATCRWYIWFTAALRAFGSWISCTQSYSSLHIMSELLSHSPILVRCARISRCMPSSLSFCAEMVSSSAELFLWARSSSPSICLICSFISTTSTSRGSICFLSSLIL
mmetsp:Transcript_27671/g.82725  ORF Transcript_27671/g.82725 Transcript_27671/m.82725 type:complete len:201 (-) Transcript_27671:2793-3395(-)